MAISEHVLCIGAGISDSGFTSVASKVILSLYGAIFLAYLAITFMLPLVILGPKWLNFFNIFKKFIIAVIPNTLSPPFIMPLIILLMAGIDGGIEYKKNHLKRKRRLLYKFTELNVSVFFLIFSIIDSKAVPKPVATAFSYIVSAEALLLSSMIFFDIGEWLYQRYCHYQIQNDREQ